MVVTVLCLLLLLPLLLATPVAAQAPLEISFWYGVGGQLEKVIQSQAEKFNRSQPGVKVVPFYAGAYGAAMASNYNRRPLPAEVRVDAGRWQVIRRRQTVDDMLALEE